MRWIENYLVDSWIDECDVSPGTERALRYDLLMYERHIASRGTVFEATVAKDVASFLEWLECEHAPSVAYHALNTVKRFYEWAERRGFHRDVAKGVSMANVENTFGARVPIRAEDARALLSACDGSRERALVALMALAAVRPREIERACVGDVRLRDPLPRIFVGREAAYLTPPCAEALEDYLVHRDAPGEDPLFISISLRNCGERLASRSIRRIVHEVYERSGIQGTLAACDLAGAAVELAVEAGAAPPIIAAIATRRATQGRIWLAAAHPPYRPPEP